MAVSSRMRLLRISTLLSRKTSTVWLAGTTKSPLPIQSQSPDSVSTVTGVNIIQLVHGYPISALAGCDGVPAHMRPVSLVRTMATKSLLPRDRSPTSIVTERKSV